jgi:regulatory protein
MGILIMQERKPRLLDAEALWNYALRALGGRAHSTGELREKLRRRAATAAEAETVLARLKEAGYLDDRGFAEGFAAARLNGQALGKRRVVNELRKRRVAPGLAEGAVEKVYSDVDEESLIEDWVRRKYRLAPREGLFQDDKDMASAYRRLLHAGFRTGQIVTVLKRFARNPGLLDEMEPPEEESE